MAYQFLSRLEIILEKHTGRRTLRIETKIRPEIDRLPHTKGARRFNKIVPVYDLFFRPQLKWYGSLLERYPSVFSGCRSVCDVGCGTGAFGLSLARTGAEVVGVDLSPAMIRAGVKKGLNCVIGDAVTALPFRDKSFDAVSAAFFIHGFTVKYRNTIYKQCSRVARKVVLFHDFSSSRNLLIDLIEYLEGSDYHNFIISAEQEMSACFSSVDILPAGPYNNWYVCRP